MLLSIGSLFIVFLITAYFIFRIHRFKGYITSSIGKLSLMVMVAVSSGFIGMLSVQTFEYQIIPSSIMSGIFVALAGFLAGQPFRKLDVVNAELSGLMGAIFGIVTGMMIFISSDAIIIIDMGYIVCSYLLLSVFDRQISKMQPKEAVFKPTVRLPYYLPTIFLASVVFVMLGVVTLNTNKIVIGQIGQKQTQVTAMDEENDLQVATIEVTASGFNPKNTEFKANTMIKVIFDVSSNSGSSLKLVSKDLKIDTVLKSGKNSFLLDDPQPGKYDFALGTGESKGSFTVAPKK